MEKMHLNFHTLTKNLFTICDEFVLKIMELYEVGSVVDF